MIVAGIRVLEPPMYFVSNGVVDPDELALLRSVLDQYSREHPKAKREEVAERLLHSFFAGKRDCNALLEAVKEALEHYSFP